MQPQDQEHVDARSTQPGGAPAPAQRVPLQLPVSAAHHQPRATILLIEDDTGVAHLEREILESSGYQVLEAHTGADGRALAVEQHPDLIIMDLMLPDVDGLVLLTNLKAAAVDAGVIICTAARRRWDAVLGLKLGADDYVAKPFDVDELEARVEAVLRRRRQQVEEPASRAPRPESGDTALGDLSLQPARHQATVAGHSLKLTPVEYNLLATLVARPETVMTREELAQAAWGRQEPAQTRTVDVYIRRLRSKLGQFSDADVPLIVSTRGMGYRLIPGSRRFHAA